MGRRLVACFIIQGRIGIGGDYEAGCEWDVGGLLLRLKDCRDGTAFVLLLQTMLAVVG